MSLITLLKKGLTILNLELFKTLTTLSQKRVEILILIAVLFVITSIIYFVNKSKTDRKDLSTICAASIFIEISFALPIALNLSFQKEGSGPVLLQSLLTISGGLVVLLGYIENRRKNNIDEKNQKMHASRYERNTKSIELIFSKKHQPQFLRCTACARLQMNGLMNTLMAMRKLIAVANKKLSQ